MENVIEEFKNVKEMPNWGKTKALPKSNRTVLKVHIQRNLSNADTIGADSSVLNRELSLIQRLLSTQMWHLGWVKVSCL